MATVIDFDNNKPCMFEMEGGGKIYLKTIATDEFNAIKKQTTKKKVDYRKVDGTASRFEYEEVNDTLQNELFWDAVIVNWENFADAKGNEIPCTKENKILLMTKSIVFAKFVSDSLKILSDDMANKKEEIEKN